MSRNATRYMDRRNRSRLDRRKMTVHEIDTRRIDKRKQQRARKTERKTQPNGELVYERTRSDIIRVMNEKFGRAQIRAKNVKHAIGQLFKHIRRPKRVIEAAFGRMLADNEVSEVHVGRNGYDGGLIYRLDPYVV